MENDAIVDTIIDNLWQEYEAKDFESFIKSIGFISLKRIRLFDKTKTLCQRA